VGVIVLGAKSCEGHFSYVDNHPPLAARSARSCTVMRKIDPHGEAAELVSTRVIGPDLIWLNETWVELGYKTRSEFLRQVVRLAQRHQEELEAAS
jgi:hypothetical protein